MARQTGGLIFRGTLGGLTYYRLNGKWLVRRKSSLDRARVLRDPAFTRSRVCARRFGVAAEIAGNVYRILPKRKRRHGLIGRLTGMANNLLFAGDFQETVGEKLLRHVLGPSAAEKLLEAVSRSRGSSSLPLISSKPAFIHEGASGPVSRQYEFALAGVP